MAMSDSTAGSAPSCHSQWLQPLALQGTVAPLLALTATQQVAQTGTGLCLSCCSHCAQGVEHEEAKPVACRT